MKTIFIVDDNATNLLAAKNILKGRYRIFAIPSAAKMFALLPNVCPDLILLDVEMPEMDGRESIRRLKASEFGAIPVVFLSAMEEDGGLLALGAKAFIQKPFTVKALVEGIEGVIGV